MSRLTDLLAQAKAADAQMGADLEREVHAILEKTRFGLQFERHRPEAVELPQRRVRKGDKVRILPARGTTAKGDPALWVVKRIVKDGESKLAELEPVEAADARTHARIDDLVVVAEFRDTIYPGLKHTGRVLRGGDKPCHTVINGENYHVLKALTWTHRGKVDAIYIDPPYNTGAKDWKYNNDYVEGDDLYRHSKWLAMMERRLKVARELLNPIDGVLVVTIDENEANRLGLLLEQVFPEYEVSPVHIVHNPRGVQGDNFSFVHETAFFVIPRGRKVIAPRVLTQEEIADGTSNLRNWGGESERLDAANCFYPIYVKEGEIVGFGDDMTNDDSIHPSHNESGPDGSVAVWPIDGKGIERKWRYARQTVEGVRHLLVVKTLRRGLQKGEIEVQIAKDEAKQKTVWQATRFDASTYGTQVVASLLLDRSFPFPKSLYATQESLDVVVRNKTNAVILDFFSGSGTTAHAVMRLNKQDGGNRQCISVTNNEVGADEQKKLREQGLRPGDAEWEALGICDYITKPRVAAAITGKTPDGKPIKGDYKFTDTFPMAEGFQENAEFFTLTYESPLAVNYQTAFAHIAPLLWLRAGSRGRCIERLPAAGWDVAEAYGLLVDLDSGTDFLKAVRKADDLRVAYIVTDDQRRFQTLARRLPEGVEAVRLYESYLTNFGFANGDEA
ncbi:MAG TPA: site-specific DNA-methyltransferase [Oleiagrimonas sp.]|nr:site-specific DNA-methyltransferase [Oleiagrimonas sp.]